MTRLSVLDFASVTEGGTVGESLTNSAALARHAEDAGYHRFWLAEHHGMPGIASAAVSVCLAHIGNATSTIRIGAGGIMLPNHNPFVIAEQFGTLDALFPGRIDLGLGRAPGADGRIARALRKNLHAAAEQFPQDVVELRALFDADERLALQAYPGAGAHPELWILGSSLFGARLAAILGLPYAFASHFAPSALYEALRVYRSEFKPSETLDRPHVMVAVNCMAAETREEAMMVASSMDQSFVALRTGEPGRLQPPIAGYRDSLPPQIRMMLEGTLAFTAIGTGADVREKLSEIIDTTQADEIILAGSTYDPQARHRALTIAMEACSGLVEAA